MPVVWETLIKLFSYIFNSETGYFHLRDAAIAILSHRDWRMAMRNKTIEDGMITTPMRKMIKKLPGED